MTREMLMSYLTGPLVLVGVLLAWTAVQCAWRRAFPEVSSDPDVLAGRTGCHGCSRGELCPKRKRCSTEEMS
jgi:hypothetical protein